MILAPTNRRVIRPYDKPSFEHTQRYGLIKGHWANANRVGLWLCNEGLGTTILDLSGNGNTGTFVSDVSWIRGKFGSALDLVGGDDYITTGAGPGNLLGSVNKNWSVSLWFRAHTPAVNGGLFQIGPLGGNHGKTYVGVIASSIYFRMNGTNYSGNFGFTDTISWHHLVCTYDGVRARLYLDNILRIDDAYSTAIDFTNSITALGIFYDLTGGFNGEIDNYLLYNRALTSSEVSQVYREPFLGIEKRTAPVYFFVPTGEVKEIAGTSVIESTTTGVLSVTREIAGAVAIASTATGVLTATREIAGVSAIESTFTGILTTTRKIAGTVAIASTTVGVLSKAGLKEIAGTVAIESTTTGILKATRELAGVVVIESITTGELTKAGVKEITGTTVISSTTSGELKMTRELIGVVAIESTTSGVLFAPPKGFSSFAENKVLDHILGKTVFGKPTAYIGFCTADPGEEGTGANCNEVPNTNGYGRIATTGADWNTASGGIVDNANLLASPEATGLWGEITHYVLVDSGSYGAGNVLVFDKLDIAKTIDEGDTIEFAAGELSLVLD